MPGRLGTRDVGPNPVDLTLEDDEAGIVSLVLEDHGRDVVVLADGKFGGDAVLRHSLTSFDLVTFPGVMLPGACCGPA